MVRKLMLAISVMLLAAFATQAAAEEGKLSVGLGSYALNLKLSNATSTQKINATGPTLVVNYDLINLVSINSHVYSVEYTMAALYEFRFVPTKYATFGFDTSVRFGKNNLGFTYFASLGYFNETMKISAASVTSRVAVNYFSGALIGAGIGYQWDHVNITLDAAVRSTGDYENVAPTAPPIKATATSGSLNVSYVF